MQEHLDRVHERGARKVFIFRPHKEEGVSRLHARAPAPGRLVGILPFNRMRHLVEQGKLEVGEIDEFHRELTVPDRGLLQPLRDCGACTARAGWCR